VNRQPGLLLAGAAWLGSLAGWWGVLTAAGAVGAVTGVAVGATLVVRQRRWRLVVAVLLAAVAGATTASVARIGAEPPATVLDRPLDMTVRTTTTAKPIQSRNPASDRVMLLATVTSYQDRGQSRTLSLPVRIFGDSTLAAHPVGSEVRVWGRLVALEPGQSRSVLNASRAQSLSPPTAAMAAVAPLRQGLQTALADADDEPASLVAGLAIGDESRQDPQFAEVMQRSGLSHLTAVSGGNVTIVVGAVVLLVVVLGWPRRVQVLIAAVALLGYVVLVGPQPSVIRAGAMGAVGLLGVVLGGAPRGLPLVGSCVLLLVLLSPSLSVSLGFALSVVATAALVTAAGPLAGWLGSWPLVGRCPRPLLLALAVTVAAQAATAPLLLAIGAPVSWVAVPANLAAAPLVAPITVLGLLAALTGSWLPGVANLLSVVAVVPAGWLAAIAHWGATTSTQSAPIPAIAATVAIIGSVLMTRRRRSRNRPAAAATRRPGRWWRVVPIGGALAAALLLVTAWIVIGVRPGATGGSLPGPWEVLACDVGQGTAVALRDSDGAVVLIDTGPPDGQVVDCLTRAGVDSLAAVVITHHHLDHYGALDQVLQRYPVRQVWRTPGSEPESGAASVQRTVAANGAQLNTLTAGQQFTLGGLTARILWPPPGGRGVWGGDPANNASVTLQAIWADGTTALITGDIEPEAQRAIMAAVPARQHDVVLVPHHGSDNQNSEFARWSGGALAIASAGENDYGHPAANTEAEYLAAGSVWLVTAEEGSIAATVADDQVHYTRLD
jgi:competence protein ComEC